MKPHLFARMGTRSGPTPAPAEQDAEDQKTEPDGDENRREAETVDHRAIGLDAGALAEEEDEREQRYAGAARLGRHLRRVGLQRVVEHVEAEADPGHGGREAGRSEEHTSELQSLMRNS